MIVRKFKTNMGKYAVKIITPDESAWRQFMDSLSDLGTMAGRLNPKKKDSIGVIAERLKYNYKGYDPIDGGRPSTILLEDDFHNLLSAFCDIVDISSKMMEVIIEDMDNKEMRVS